MKMISIAVRLAAPALILALALMAVSGLKFGATAFQATPPPVGCDTATPSASPMVEDDAGTMEMGAGTPMAGMAMDVEFDQLYIDMMLPHHGSIVAMSQAALPLIEDERLRTIAQRIIDTQTAEQAELQEYRELFYGSPDVGSMDATGMDAMMMAMPGMGTMDEMIFQMDAAAQVAAICAAPDVDLAFIDLAIPHHEMAIAASETAVTQAVHPEITAFAQRVIADQSAEIDELTAIRVDLAGQ